jgi:GNAT superfamily N-acetyltransferase
VTQPIRHERLALQPLGLDDVDSLQAVYDAAPDFFQVIVGSHSAAPDAASNELRQAAQPGREVALIRLPDGSVAGALGWWAGKPSEEVALLGMLLILPQHRGQGLARAALEALEGSLAGQGITQLRTAIPYRRATPAVRAILQAFGFQPMPVAEHTRMGMSGAGISLWHKQVG